MIAVAFSGSLTARVCVDCLAPARWSVVYANYEIADLACDEHSARRQRVTASRRWPIPDDLRIDGADDVQSAA